MGGIQFIVVLVSFVALQWMNRSAIHGNLRHIYVVLFVGSFLIIISLIGFALSSYVVGLLAFYVIIQVTRQAMYPLEDIWLNKIIPDSSTRATFFSVKGQVDAIGQIGGGTGYWSCGVRLYNKNSNHCECGVISTCITFI